VKPITCANGGFRCLYPLYDRRLGSSADDYVQGEVVGSKRLSSPNIVSRQPRMVGKNCLKRQARAQLAEHERACLE
jgi:hypothetical protein